MRNNIICLAYAPFVKLAVFNDERSCSNSLPLVAKWTVRKSNWTASARFNDVAGYLGPSLDGALTETTVLPVTEHDEMVDAALLTA